MTILLDELIGHDPIREALDRTRRGGRLPHALLFSGPAGVGKRSAALALAAALNCALGADGPCGRCRACRRAGNPLGSYPDVMQFADLDEAIPVPRSAALAAGLIPPEQGLPAYLESLAALHEAGILARPVPGGGGPGETDFLLVAPEAVMTRESGRPESFSATRVQQVLDGLPDSPSGLRPVAAALLGGLGPWIYRRMLRVSHIRNVLEGRIRLRPDEGATRVFILDGAHRMNEQAQNALLKTLEEPPGWSLIVLVTDRPFLLLPTVRSRCQELRFGSLPIPVLAEEAARRFGLAPPEAELWAALSRGSLGRLLRVDWPTELARRDQVAQALEELDLDRADTVLSSAEALLGTAEPGTGGSLQDTLDWVESLLHDAALVGLPGGGQPVNRDLDPRRLAERLRIPPDRLGRARRWVGEIRRSLEVNVNPRLAVEALLVRIARLRPEALP